jgi:hypothetical protein
MPKKNTHPVSQVGVRPKYGWLRKGNLESNPWAADPGRICGPRARIVWPCQWGPHGRPLPSDRAAPTAPSRALVALRSALGWRGELASGELRRSDIARREGISRARVTQILGLLNLPKDTQLALLEGRVELSIREAAPQVREAGGET